MLNGRFERLWPQLVRIAGLGIALYETVLESADRPSLLLLAGGMMGLKNVIDLQKAVNASKTKNGANGVTGGKS